MTAIKSGEGAGSAVRSKRLTVRVSPGMANRLRNTSAWVKETVVSIIERAIDTELDRIAKTCGPAPQRTTELRPGRRKKRASQRLR